MVPSNIKNSKKEPTAVFSPPSTMHFKRTKNFLSPLPLVTDSFNCMVSFGWKSILPGVTDFGVVFHMAPVLFGLLKLKFMTISKPVLLPFLPNRTAEIPAKLLYLFCLLRSNCLTTPIQFILVLEIPLGRTRVNPRVLDCQPLLIASICLLSSSKRILPWLSRIYKGHFLWIC